MTLLRQIFWTVSLLFLLLLVTLEASYVRHAREYLQEQLTSHAQDVATSLGMVLPTSLAQHDTIRLETTVNAVFDRGFYRTIRVVDVQGQTLLLRELPATPPDVPAWFTRLVKLDAPAAQSLISHGWSQLGRVIVVSHPNFAYQQLWHTTVATTGWTACFYVVALLLLRAFLSAILRPLSDIEGVAHEIGERRFPLIERMPWAPELLSVVQAINTLSGKMRDILAREVASAEHFRLEAYQDPLTGLGNRRSFLQQLDTVRRERADQPAALYLIQIQGLGTLNANQGRSDGDQRLLEVGNLLKGLNLGDQGCVCRLGGSTFAILAWNLQEEASQRLGQQLTQLLGQLDLAATLELGVGALYLAPHRTCDISYLLGDADSAARQALTQPNGINLVWRHHDPSALIPHGAESWQGFIVRALEQQRIQLWAQPVLSLDEPTRCLHREITGALLNDDGTTVTAREFVPMAIRQGVMACVDRTLLNVLFEHLEKLPDLSGATLAVNLSAHSLVDSTFVEELLARLAEHPALASRLVFELAEFGVVHHRPQVSRLVEALRAQGSRFAIDNFGFHSSAFQYLQALRPSYIKLSQDYINDLENSLENQFFIASVVRVARPLEILTLACGVESASRLELLRHLGVDGAQGFALAPPQRIVTHAAPSDDDLTC